LHNHESAHDCAKQSGLHESQYLFSTRFLKLL